MAMNKSPVFLFAYIMYMLTDNVSADCSQLTQCFSSGGIDTSSFLYNPNMFTFMEFVCQNPDKIGNCFQQYPGCNEYEDVGFTERSPGKLKLVCKHKSLVEVGFNCSQQFIQKTKPADMRKMQECGMNEPENLSACKEMEYMVNCNPVSRGQIRCQANVMIALAKDGIQIPCLSVYQSASIASTYSINTVLVIIAFMAIKFSMLS